MIGFYKQIGGPLKEKEFTELFEKRYHISERFKALNSEDYGNDVSLILIELYIEGEITYLGPKSLTISRYRSNEKSIGIKIPIFKNSLTPEAFIKYIFDSMNNGLQKARIYLSKKKIIVDWERLFADVQKIEKNILKTPFNP